MRWFLIVVAVALAVIASLFRYSDYFASSTNFWVFNSLVKVALVLLASSLAYPQLQRLNRSRYGKIILGGAVVFAMFFIARPKASAALLPMIGAALLVLLVLTFMTDVFSDEKK